MPKLIVEIECAFNKNGHEMSFGEYITGNYHLEHKLSQGNSFRA